MSTLSYGNSQKPPMGMEIQGQSMHSSSRPQSSVGGYGTKKSASRIQSASGYGSKQKPSSIPLSDLLKIRGKIGLDDNETRDDRTQEKLDLYEKSQQRVKNWPNTLHGLRKKKDSQRFERFKKDEEDRRRIDEEERIYQAEEKKKILDKANKQIYDRDDRVKEFSSKINLVETIDQRKQQMELKHAIKEISKKREEIYSEQLADALRKEDEKEMVKKELLKKKRAQTAKVLREQHDEQRKRHIEKVQNDKIEGEIIKVRAQELLDKEKEEEYNRKQKALQLQADIMKGNDELQILRTHLKAKEKDEDLKIAQHAEKKQLLQDMRKKREKHIFDEKQKERAKLIEKQTAQLKKLKDAEDARVNKEIKEAEIKAEEIEKIKREKRKQMVKNFDKSIKINMETKRAQTAKQREEDEDYKNFWIKKNKDIQQREVDEKVFYKDRCKELSDFHKLQALEKEKARERKFLKELEEEQKIKKIQENDQSNFNSWAQRMIIAQKEDGKDVMPLLTQLAKLNQPPQ